jgi:MCP family monocarboxylic acid transporter-like MFS transporter 10
MPRRTDGRWLVQTIKPRKAPIKVPGGMLNLRAFDSCAYCCASLPLISSIGWRLTLPQCVVGSFFVMLGLYTPLSYLDVTGTQLNLGEYSTYLISIANAASLFGRLIPGLVGDPLGPFNLLIPGLLGSAATVS